ncbi:hotdog fold thioesterase [Caviibacterium pharyngocola]|uniref:Esterase n=1 Tax=Caviibacterium pharyngocola TaxID=28159 RepID=A0A2M8RUU3_9PAST|nr:hotdog fold thioesterase [Caviibacterium pharyngocola]PJG82658.1 esterase [Caviibacterium pharyngocola]
MNIWKKQFSLKQLNRLNEGCAVDHLGIEFTAQGDDWLEATMTVNHKTTQPMGLLHGGISAALAETVGSLAGFCCVEQHQAVVGIELNASHLRPVSGGNMIAKASPVRLGKTLHVWQIDIRDQQDKLCCSARLTLSVINQ